MREKRCEQGLATAKIVRIFTVEIRNTMFKIINIQNGKEFLHHTEMGVLNDEAVLTRYDVEYTVEEFNDPMDNFGFK